MSRVEVLPVVTQITRQRAVDLLEPHDHHLGYLPGTKGIEVGIVSQRLFLPREGVGRIMHQRTLRPLLTKRLIEGCRHAGEVDDRHILPPGHSLHGLRIVAVGVLDGLVVVIEEATGCGRAEDDVASRFAHTVDEYLQIARIGIPGAVAGLLLLLIVVAELHDDIVAGLQLGEDLVESQLGKEGCARQAALCEVGDSHLRREPTGDHLSPRGPWLVLLVDHGRIAAEEDCNGLRCLEGTLRRLDPDALYSRSRTAEREAERVVPVLIPHLARLQLHPHIAFDDGVMLVDDEGDGLELPLLGRHHIYIMAPRLSTDDRLAGLFLVPQRDRHQIVAVWHSNREEERTIRGAVQHRIDHLRIAE